MRDIDEVNAVIFHILPGKPDPQNLKHRKTQAAQKGLTCSYYAMHRIRIRYAKNDTSQARIIEKLVSTNRKKMTALSTQLSAEYGFLVTIENVRKQNADSINSKDVKVNVSIPPDHQFIWDKFVSDYAIWKAKKNPDAKIDTLPSTLDIIRDPALSQFVNERHDEITIQLNKSMLQSYGVNINLLHFGFPIPMDWLNQSLIKNMSLEKNKKLFYQVKNGSNLDPLNSNVQSIVLHNCVISKEAELYGLQLGTIDDQEFQDYTINDMLALLRQNKAMVIFGELGRPYYMSDKIKTTKIGENTYCSFATGSYTTNQVQGGHTIVLVGASKPGYKNTTQDLIYFVDPSEPSPVNESTKIYVMSFKNFKDRLQNKRNHYLEQQTIKKTTLLYFFKPNIEENVKNTSTNICERMNKTCTIL